jgi:NitT/TauT family transport system substrate-binding protein
MTTLLDRREFVKIGAGALLGGLAFTSKDLYAQKDPIEMKVGLSGGESNMAFCVYYVGGPKGFDRQEGISVRRVNLEAGGSTVRGLTEGGLQLVVPSFTATILAFNQGQPVRVIASGFASAGAIAWIARADSPLMSFRDIKAKKIGYSRPGSNTHFHAQEAVRAAGLKPEEVTLVPVGSAPAAWTAVKTGVVDVAWSVEPLPTKVTLDQEGKVIWTSDAVLKDWVEAAVVTTEEHLRSNREALQRYMRSYIKSMDFVKTNPEEAVQTWAEMVGFKDVDLARKAIKNWPSKAWTARFTPRQLKEVERSMMVMKQIEKPVDWNRLLDQSLLPPEMRIQM